MASCAPAGMVPSGLRTRKMPDIPVSEWDWTWQWYIHAPGPTPSPAITWKPNELPGSRFLLSMTWEWSFAPVSMPVRVSAQRWACRWKVCGRLPWPMQIHSTRSPWFASNIGVSGATLLLMDCSLNTTVYCRSGSRSPRLRTIRPPYRPCARPPVPWSVPSAWSW